MTIANTRVSWVISSHTLHYRERGGVEERYRENKQAQDECMLVLMADKE